jgi:hypothetical protein
LIVEREVRQFCHQITSPQSLAELDEQSLLSSFKIGIDGFSREVREMSEMSEMSKFCHQITSPQ